MLRAIRKKWKEYGYQAGWITVLAAMAICGAAGAGIGALVLGAAFAWTSGSIGVVGGGIAAMLILLNE